MTTDHVFREAIAIAYERPRKRTKLDTLEDAARVVMQSPDPKRADSNTTMASEQKRITAECRMREQFRATATGRFTPDQIAEQKLLLARAKARREADLRPDQRWSK